MHHHSIMTVLALIGSSEGPNVTVHEPTRVDIATERSTASCRGVEVSIERPLLSEASRVGPKPTVTVNGRALDGPEMRPFLGFLAEQESMYRIVFTCGHDRVVGALVSRASGSRSGRPSYSYAAAFFSDDGLVQFNPPEVGPADTFWLR